MTIQLEVPFVCLYEKQPSIGEIDIWMRSNGYIPHCFLAIKRWSIKPTVFNNDIRYPGNQLLESDLVYIRDPFKLETLDNEQLKKLIIISHNCFKSIDFSAYIILELEKRNILPKNSHKKYLINVKSFTL